MEFADAIKAGGLTAIEAIRDSVAADLAACTSYRDRATLYLRLFDALEKVDNLRALEVVGDDIDQLRQRRAKRRGPASMGARRN